MVCRLCQSRAVKIKFITENVHGREKLGPDIFTVYECARCGVTFTDVDTGPGYFSRYYPQDYYPQSPRNFFIKWLIDRLSSIGFNFHYRLIKRFKPNAASILEIGCAKGDFLSRLPGSFHKYGIELNEAFCEYIRRHYTDITVRNTKIGAGAKCFSGMKFDCIVLWQVFEHVDNPTEFLKEVGRMLSSQGVCILEVPNRNSLGSRLMPREWFHLDTPRHLFFYSRRTMETLLGSCGLKIAGYMANPVDYIQDLASSVYISIRNAAFPVNVLLLPVCIPIAIMVRMIVSLCLPMYAEINVYVVKHSTDGALL